MGGAGTASIAVCRPTFKFTEQQAEGQDEVSLLAGPAAGTQLAEFDGALEPEQGTQKG